MMRSIILLLLCVQAYSVLGDDCSSDSCSADQTCCEGQFLAGCCPLVSAVCCSDGLHCCPENTVCNLNLGTCDNENSNNLIPIPFRKHGGMSGNKVMKAVALKEARKGTVVYCPDGQHYCPDGNTCCRTPAGEWRCCPYPSATCCHDGLHCCPHGNRCDPTSRYCFQGSFYGAPKKQGTPALTLY